MEILNSVATPTHRFFSYLIIFNMFWLIKMQDKFKWLLLRQVAVVTEANIEKGEFQAIINSKVITEI